MEMKFIKNTIVVDVDGLKSVNHYTIKGMYNRIDEEGFATIEYKLIDKFDYTWEEIERDGGIAQVNKDLKECYGV